MKLLFVCMGNTCRSPMASAIFNKKARALKLDFSSDSCGIAVNPGDCANPLSVEVCKSLNVDLTQHKVKSIRDVDLNSYDRIIALSQNIKDFFTYCGCENDKVILLGNGISDPYGGNIDVYTSCRDEISRELDKLIEVLKNDA